MKAFKVNYYRIWKFGGDTPSPFSSVMMLMVCLFFPKNVWFGRNRMFKVLGLHGPFNLTALSILGF
jgi:hypothetical protein